MVARRKWAMIVFAIGLVVGVVVWSGVFSEREPEYGGKRLSEWVMAGYAGSVTTFAHPMPDNVLVLGSDGMSTSAQEAIRRLGTEAIPYLLRWTAYEPPRVKTRMIRFVNEKFGWSLHERALQRAYGAYQALRVLGSEAAGAIPELTRLMLKARTDESASRFANLLVGLGSAGMPALLTVLTSHQATPRTRYYAAVHIPGWNNYTPEAVRALEELAADRDPYISRGVITLLRQIAAERLKKKQSR